MYLYGARGHAKVIIEVLEAQRISIEGLFDDNVGLKSLLNYPVFQWNQELDIPLFIPSQYYLEEL